MKRLVILIALILALVAVGPASAAGPIIAQPGQAFTISPGAGMELLSISGPVALVSVTESMIWPSTGKMYKFRALRAGTAYITFAGRQGAMPVLARYKVNIGGAVPPGVITLRIG
jgi:hypothetical protein